MIKFCKTVLVNDAGDGLHRRHFRFDVVPQEPV